jgi:imidazole glycerol phosphate synthase subunit HisF
MKQFIFFSRAGLEKASITHFESYTITQMKEYLRDRGIAVNL